MTFDPANPKTGKPNTTSGSKPKKKIAFLVGTGKRPEKIHILYLLNLFRGQSMYWFDLVNEEHDCISRPDPVNVETIKEIGHSCDRPERQVTDVPFWIAHGRREANRLGLTIGK